MKIVMLTASWCMPCKSLKPVIAKVAADFPDVQVDYYDIDTDAGSMLCKEHSLRAVPAVIVFNGDEVKIRTGSMKQSDIISMFAG